MQFPRAACSSRCAAAPLAVGALVVGGVGTLVVAALAVVVAALAVVVAALAWFGGARLAASLAIAADEEVLPFVFAVGVLVFLVVALFTRAVPRWFAIAGLVYFVLVAVLPFEELGRAVLIASDAVQLGTLSVAPDDSCESAAFARAEGQLARIEGCQPADVAGRFRARYIVGSSSGSTQYLALRP